MDNKVSHTQHTLRVFSSGHAEAAFELSLEPGQCVHRIFAAHGADVICIVLRESQLSGSRCRSCLHVKFLTMHGRLMASHVTPPYHQGLALGSIQTETGAICAAEADSDDDDTPLFTMASHAGLCLAAIVTADGEQLQLCCADSDAGAFISMPQQPAYCEGNTTSLCIAPAGTEAALWQVGFLGQAVVFIDLATLAVTHHEGVWHFNGDVAASDSAAFVHGSSMAYGRCSVALSYGHSILVLDAWRGSQGQKLYSTWGSSPVRDPSGQFLACWELSVEDQVVIVVRHAFLGQIITCCDLAQASAQGSFNEWAHNESPWLEPYCLQREEARLTWSADGRSLCCFDIRWVDGSATAGFHVLQIK